MVGLAIINLLWIIFDSAWSVPELRNIMAWLIPMQYLNAYATVHEHFFRIDLIFVSLFLTEFTLRWADAVIHRRYQHPMVYPILHWYDIIGCIPVAGLRWLRILRVFAILLRLQRLGVIDYTQWTVYGWGKRLYDVVMEEISDRVVIRVLSGVQDELAASGDLERKILRDVVAPRQALVIDSIRNGLVDMGQGGYAAARDDLHQFVTEAVAKAVHKNREIKMIDKIPVVGGMASGVLDHAITDIICHALDELAGRLSSEEFESVFNDICNSVFQSLLEEGSREQRSNRELMLAISDVLEAVKSQVSKRRWLEI